MKIVFGIGGLLIMATIAMSTIGHRALPGGKTNVARTVVLTAMDMKFNISNPTVVIAPGEVIRIVMRNEDPGMKHDLVIPQLGLRTPVLEPGEEAVLEFRAPRTGSLEYLCSFHPISMRGFLSIAEVKESS